MLVSDSWYAFLEEVADLLENGSVLQMRNIPHHIGCTCFEHSMFVGYLAFRTARRWGLDYRAAARGGLLHDLYLYDAEERARLPGNHYLEHPAIALKNAEQVTELTEKERDIIISHMWPIGRARPRSPEAAIVNCVDKYCATAEALGIWRRMKVCKFEVRGRLATLRSAQN